MNSFKLRMISYSTKSLLKIANKPITFNHRIGFYVNYLLSSLKKTNYFLIY